MKLKPFNRKYPGVDDFEEQSTVGLDMRNVTPPSRKIRLQAQDPVLLVLYLATYVPIIVCGDVGHVFTTMLIVLAGATFITLDALIILDTAWAWWCCTILWLTGMEIANVALINAKDSPLALAVITVFIICPFAFGFLIQRKFRGWEAIIKLVGMVLVLNLAIFVGVKYIFP